jgi:hypothetical protein
LSNQHLPVRLNTWQARAKLKYNPHDQELGRSEVRPGMKKNQAEMWPRHRTFPNEFLICELLHSSEGMMNFSVWKEMQFDTYCNVDFVETKLFGV